MNVTAVALFSTLTQQEIASRLASATGLEVRVEEGAFSAPLDGSLFSGLLFDKPFPSADIEAWKGSNVMFAGAYEEAKACRSHVALSFGGPDDTTDRISLARKLSQIIAKIDPDFVIWIDSKSVIPGNLFSRQIASEGGQKFIPSLWIAPRFYGSRDATGANMGVISRGLKPFCGYEIALAPTLNPKPKALIEKLFHVCVWAAAGQVSLNHGETIQWEDGQEVLKIAQVDTPPGEGPVFELQKTSRN